MGWLADLLKEIPSAARYKAELEQLAREHPALKEENATLKAALEKANADLAASRFGAVDDLGPDKEKILRLLSERDRLAPQAIASACGMGLELANFHLEELFDPHEVAIIVAGLWKRAFDLMMATMGASKQYFIGCKKENRRQPRSELIPFSPFNTRRRRERENAGKAPDSAFASMREAVLKTVTNSQQRIIYEVESDERHSY